MQEVSFEEMWQSSLLDGDNAIYLEALYEQYLQDPSAVPSEWRSYFQNLPRVNGAGAQEALHSEAQQEILHYVQHKNITPTAIEAPVSGDAAFWQKQMGVFGLINAYRSCGHKRAQIDPLQLTDIQIVQPLTLEYHGLSNADFNTEFATLGLLPKKTATLKEIETTLQSIYCSTIGAEYMYVSDDKERNWLQQRIEATRPTLEKTQKQHLLKQLTAAEGLEKFLHTKFVGQKRFSLEGCESLIPALHEIIHRGSAVGVKEHVIGMAHRGRLNVLVNIFGKLPSLLFKEFEGKHDHTNGSGDVKYHMGFSSDIETAQGPVHLVLAFNPSHLEIVSPVVEGSVRARQERRQDKNREQILPILIHGDAAFAGQGVVMETFNMSQTRGFGTGGTVHLVVNNQVGFTTSERTDARSTLYCTDIAKMVAAPVLHVNADDPEAVLFAAGLALDYRTQFKKDVVIDLVGYRRLGHNEADEPSATQPIMYQIIKQRPSVLSLYTEQLIAENMVDKATAEAFINQYRDALDAGENHQVKLLKPLNNGFTVDWTPYQDNDWDVAVDTTCDLQTVRALGERLEILPEGFVLQAQVGNIMENRKKMTEGKIPADWGYAETLAYASLLKEGFPIRLVGQDSGRGTFAHRHAVLHDQKTDAAYIPLQHIADKQPQFTVIDSLLSEEAVLGFEYGYAVTEPRALVIWEAQFGDFVNGAQVVIDQFISSGEQKWGRLCGLVMFVPHGYEGMGPEHSSARLERYLQLCAQHNIQVCVPTTPAQTFHMLRRQMLRPFRKPLIVMTPKSFLRHKLAISSLTELAEGSFQPVIPEVDDLPVKNIKRVILCSGKVYYDLITKRNETARKDVAIIRIEQLYPFPEKILTKILAGYDKVKDIIWCQEEPMNQGAWYCSQHHILACLGANQRLQFAGREASASPATGYAKLHNEEQAALIAAALGS